MKKLLILCLACCSLIATVRTATAQGLTDMSHSKQALMQNLPLGATQWTGGFWGERFNVLSTTGIWSMWETWNTPYETIDALGQHGSHGFANFQAAAGTVKGKHHGPPFHDGDMYKWLEACAAVYAVTKDPKLDALMDRFIEQVALAQRADGYIHTPVVIAERNQGIDSHAGTDNAAGIEIGKDQKHAFASRLNFETYNLGHLMTAGIVHKRATGKTTLFDCGRKAADFLYNFLTNDAAELSRNAICPSHYMGAAEMYRETGDQKYLRLAEGLIAIRDSVTNGEDHNQDRLKFRDQYEAMGHAVRANYLYAGVADLYAETGEQQLKRNLEAIWDDIVNHKIYIMGGCGALYDGVSPDGTTYNQPYIQQIHQAYGRQFQLPQEAAHNEICAQIGMLLFSWRMYQTDMHPKYVDIIENELYNGILSGISLDGRDFFYTEALRRTKEFPYTMRWPKHRQRYITCFCCPPNTLRTLCQAQEYAYSVKGDTLWVNLYGQNTLKTKDMEIEQQTSYPWDGHITLTVKRAKRLASIRMHIPGWSDGMTLRLNGKDILAEDLRQPRKWKKGDQVELILPMKPRLIEANPLVEEAKNQVAVMRGPIVYCLEGDDISATGASATDKPRINDIAIPADVKFTETTVTIADHQMVALEADVPVVNRDFWGKDDLYRELRPVRQQTAHIRLIPYYAWDNRGIQDMSLWLPLAR
ncbi:MAG: glycoside hydrolase family 127 protein [Prevotella sp.]|nr:glycoside hydrolase family 127 protein [Prevotella sp.]